MAITREELQAAIIGERTDIREIYSALTSLGFVDTSSVYKQVSKALSNTTLPLMSFEKEATAALVRHASSYSAAVGGSKVSLEAIKQFIDRDVTSYNLIGKRLAETFDLSYKQGLYTGAMIDKSLSSLSSLIGSFRVDANSISFLYKAALPDLLNRLNPYREVEQALSSFYEAYFTRFQDVIDPFRSDVAQLYCDVESVRFDIAEGTKRVIHAEYDRSKVLELLSAIIIVKESEPEPRLDLEDGFFDSESLFNCLDEHDTHSGRYVGKVNVRILDNKKSLQEWVEQIKKAGHIDNERADDIDFLARRAELIFRRNFPKVVYDGVLSLAEAAVRHALNDPLTADEIQLLERRMGATIRREFPRPTVGGNTQRSDTWEKLPPAQFAKKADELYDVADSLLDWYNNQKSNTNWLKMAKLSDDFALFLNICSEEAIDEVAGLIPARLKGTRSKTHKHAFTPLAFACELAACELDIRKKNNKRYAVETLLKKYREGGGVRGKLRIRAKARKKAS
jgi:hypothetical protein